MQRSTAWWLVLGVGISLATVSVTHAGGIEVPMQSSKAAAEADAFTAQADDPSAIFYNPAGLTQLTGTQASLGAYYLQPVFHFRGDDGSNERMNIPSVLPHAYISTDFGSDKFRVGFGVNDVFGINEDWGNKGPLRLLVDKAQLSVINAAPTLAYQVDEHLSIGAAANFYYGTLNLERNVLLGAPPIPEGHFRDYGNDYAFGVTPGLMYKLNETSQIGMYYRSPFTLDFKGKARVTSTVIPEIGPSNAHESISFPQSAGIGYAVHPVPPLTLEADGIWTDWHSVDQLKIHSSDPHFNNQTIRADWKSGFTFRGGVQYQLNENWAIRGGYAYGQTSVPQSTFNPIVPDSNYHLGAIGIGYSSESWSLDLAYNYIYRERRHIHNDVNSPAVDGSWDNQMQGLMLTFGVKL